MKFDSELYRSGSFDEIMEWFIRNQPADAPIHKMEVTRWTYGPADGNTTKSWDGRIAIHSEWNPAETVALFSGSKIEIFACDDVNKNADGSYRMTLGFVMLEEEWTPLAVMQALSR